MDLIAPEHLTRKEKNKIYQKRYRESEKGKANGKRYRQSPKGKLNSRVASIRHRLKRRYGLSLSDYNEMLKEQNGVCWICKRPETMRQGGRLKPLAVDHCHESGVVRGLLCNRCNRVVGFVEEDISILQSSIDYIKSWNRSKVTEALKTK